MFAIEINFNDGVSPSETVFLRRTSAILGGTDRSDLIVEGSGSDLPEIQLTRLQGREFSVNTFSNILKFNNYANVKFGNYDLGITSLDYDLSLTNEEYPEVAAVKALRKSFSKNVNNFPAVSILNQFPSIISFYDGTEIIVGRLSKCLIRIESSDVSSEHCKFGLDSQGVWVEDLGSTNGTFVNQKKISGRKYLKKEDIVSVGSNAILLPLFSEEDLNLLENNKIFKKNNNTKFPCITSNSSDVKPAFFDLPTSKVVTIGRDPASDIWVNAPHISREHLNVTLTDKNDLVVVDKSSNGSFVEGKRLEHGQKNNFSSKKNIILDLCSGVELEVLFSKSNNLEGEPKNKLNKENTIIKDASLELELSKPSSINLEDIFEDEHEFNVLAEKFEKERLKENKAMEVRVLLLTLLLVFTLITICLLVFSSDYFLF